MEIDSIDKLIEHVVETTDRSLPKLYQIRYVYLETGKYLQKNTDFFFSLKNKLGEDNYSNEMLKKLYNDDKTTDIDGWNKVVCRGTAIVLKRIFDELGIESKIVKTTATQENSLNLDFDIHHYFVAVSDGKDNYFLTLNADLGNIQNHMQTKHFGNNISYIREDSDGVLRQVYEGEEIPHKVLSDDDLFNIDKKIGYTTKFMFIEHNNEEQEKDVYYDDFLEMLRNEMRGNRWYLNRLVEETSFFKRLNFDDGFILNKEHIHNLEEIKMKILTSFGDMYSNYDDWLFDFEYKKRNGFLTKEEYQRDSLIRSTIEELNRIEKVIMNDQFTPDASNVFNIKFIRKLYRLGYYFINPKYLPPNSENNYATSDYISKKLEVLFREIFDANSGYNSDFNRLGYSEQEGLIKNYILGKIAFSDVKKENSLPPYVANDEYVEKAYKYFDENIPIIYNRIYFRAARNKQDGRYCLTFTILQQTKDEVDRYFIYDLQKNTFREYRNNELIDFYNDWRVCKVYDNNLNNNLEVENIENIDDTDDFEDDSTYKFHR